MTDQPPRRLLDDPAVAPELRADLQAVQQHGALPYDTALGLEALRATLEAGAAATTAAGTGAAGTAGATGSGMAGTGAAAGAGTAAMSAGLKLTVAVALTVTAAGGALLSVREAPMQVASPNGVTTATRGDALAREARQPPSRQEGAPSFAEASALTAAAKHPSLQSPAAPASEFKASAEPTLMPSQRAGLEVAPPAPVRAQLASDDRPLGARTAEPTANASQPQPAAVAEPSDPGLDEVRLLARTREALQGDPSLALRLAQQGERDHANGTFGEERRALMVLALHALGRFDEVSTQGRRFLQSHPRSPFAARIRALVERVP